METETKTMGALLPGIVDSQTGAVALSAPLTSASQLLDLATLPARIDDAALALLDEISDAPVVRPQPCEESHYAKCMRSLAILPRKAEDDLSGQLRDKLYFAKLKGFSNDALSFLVSKALDQCHWFPTIAECLKILAGWPNAELGESRKAKARILFNAEVQARFDEQLAALERRELDEEQIAALGDKVKRVAAEKCYLWRLTDGRFIVRRDTFGMSEEELEANRAEVAKLQEDGLL